MVFNTFAVGSALGLWALSSLPTAYAALSWSTCTKDEKGQQVCKSRIPRGARIAIAVCCLVVLVLLLTLVVCICKNRRTARASEQEYNVEASQMQGPPTIIATEYNPDSGRPSGVYSGGPQSAAPMSGGHLSPFPQMTGPSVPVASYQYQSRPVSQTHTAPVYQTEFSNQKQDPPAYPFSYDARNASNPPKTAYVTNGFPRPLLAGNRLKDRLKERPASISSLNSLPGPPPSR